MSYADDRAMKLSWDINRGNEVSLAADAADSTVGTTNWTASNFSASNYILKKDIHLIVDTALNWY